MTKKPYTTTHPNGSVIRSHNKRIQSVIETPGEVCIHFQFLGESPEIPTCHHEVTHKGKVRYTFIKLSEETLDALVQARIAYLEYKRNNHE